MAKANKPQSNHIAVQEQQEHVITTTNSAPEPEQAQNKQADKVEVDLKYGQCIISPIGKPDEELVTTIDDWNSLYNAGANQGKFVLKTEKKSL